MGQFIARCVLAISCLVYFTACNPVRIATDKMGLTEKGIQAGEKIHLKVPPDQAIRILDDIASQHGWSIVSVGDQYDMQGQRGKYYRMETTRFIGGRKEMSGVFFNEPEGCFTIVGKNDAGLPDDLVEPFLAAVTAHVNGENSSPPNPN